MPLLKKLNIVMLCKSNGAFFCYQHHVFAIAIDIDIFPRSPLCHGVYLLLNPDPPHLLPLSFFVGLFAISAGHVHISLHPHIRSPEGA